MAQKICFCSLKGGTGKTTVCINLAYSLANAGEKVLVIDGDSKSSGACLLAGCSGEHSFSLRDVQDGTCRAKQTLVEHSKFCNLFICSSQNCTDGVAFSRAIDELEPLFDFILCDDCAQEKCQKIFVVTEPYAPSIKSADACVSQIKNGHNGRVFLVVNKVNGGQIFDGEIITPEEIAHLLRTPLVGVIPEDLTLCTGKINARTKRAFLVFADNVKREKNVAFNCTKAYLGAWGAFKKWIRKKL